MDILNGRKLHRNVLALAVAFVAGSCTGDDGGSMQAPHLDPPHVIGLNSTLPGGTLTLCAATTGNGDGLEYQFDFRVGQNGGLLDWSTESCQSHSWAFEGRYTVHARIRRGDLVSDWSDDWIIVVINETISPPLSPSGDSTVVVGTELRLCGSGAVSDLGHPVEYRFRVDPDYTFDWHIAPCWPVPWVLPGAFVARVQARCAIHDGIMSLWSLAHDFEGVSGADTRIVRAFVSPTIGGPLVDEVDLTDGSPDTVAMGSWLTLITEGSHPDYANGTCQDAINRCIRFQMQYSRLRASAGNPSRFESPWMPLLPFDSNPNGVQDTVRMNIGSVDYTVRLRAVDEFAADPTPVAAGVIGNFPPVLDDYYITRFDGVSVRHLDTLVFDWWSPENTDTVDVGANQRKKVFSFTIRASGHDDPRDPSTSNIKGWKYFFTRADDNLISFPFARASLGSWVESLVPGELADVFTWEVRYAIDDITGDSVFDNLPEWANQGWDMRVTGRDTGPADSFQQFVSTNGSKTLMNDYNTWNYGRQTVTGAQRFFIAIER